MSGRVSRFLALILVCPLPAGCFTAGLRNLKLMIRHMKGGLHACGFLPALYHSRIPRLSIKPSSSYIPTGSETRFYRQGASVEIHGRLVHAFQVIDTQGRAAAKGFWLWGKSALFLPQGESQYEVYSQHGPYGACLQVVVEKGIDSTM